MVWKFLNKLIPYIFEKFLSLSNLKVSQRPETGQVESELENLLDSFTRRSWIPRKAKVQITEVLGVTEIQSADILQSCFTFFQVLSGLLAFEIRLVKAEKS